jgi:hypothetical protein
MKLVNIIRILNNEINKGNDFISKNGNICSKEQMLKEVKKDYLRKVDNGSLDMTVSLSDYISKECDNFIKCVDVISLLSDNYGINYKPVSEKRGIIE